VFVFFIGPYFIVLIIDANLHFLDTPHFFKA